jgi:hypothetical protein
MRKRPGKPKLKRLTGPDASRLPDADVRVRNPPRRATPKTVRLTGWIS